MIRVKQIRPLKLRGSTPLSRVMAKPAMRFAFAGAVSLVITVLLFLFMIYITENFNRGSSIESEILFELDTAVVEENRRNERIRVQPPPDLAEELQTPDLQDVE